MVCSLRMAPILLLLFSLRYAVSQQTSPGENIMTESSLLKLSKKVVMPIYPVDAVRRGCSGLAIADLIITVRTSTIKVDVLEAPSTSISSELERSLKQWKIVFPMEMPGRVARVRVIRYFLLRKGVPVVRSPGEVFDLSEYDPIRSCTS